MECIFFSFPPFSYSWSLCLPCSCHKKNFRATSALWGPTAGGRWAGERKIPAGAHLMGPDSSIRLFLFLHSLGWMERSELCWGSKRKNYCIESNYEIGARSRLEHDNMYIQNIRSRCIFWIHL